MALSNNMKILKLHQNGKLIYVNAVNIECYCWDSEDGKVVLVTNYVKGSKIKVDEPLWQINEQFDLGKANTDEKGD